MSAIMSGVGSATHRVRGSDTGLAADDTISRFGQAVMLVGGIVLRYGLVGILLYLGTFKYSLTEAERIRPLVEHSPLLSWLYLVASVQGVSSLIGTAEIVIAVLLAIRPVAPRATVLGSFAAVLMFATTLSFLISTPGVFERVPDFPVPVPGAAGGFLLKDLFLLGAALWSAAEALQTTRIR